MMSERAARARPEPGEYDADYEAYVGKVTEDDVVAVLRSQLVSTSALLRAVPADRHGHRYAPHKWTLREVVGHVIDAERVFAYRALRFARGDATPLPGMDQNVFMERAAFERRSLASLIAEYEHVRRANLELFASLDADALSRGGVASERPVTVRALLYIIAGHERHHVGVLRERYL